MKKVLLLGIALACYLVVKAQSPAGKTSSLKAADVSLKGRNATTIITNATRDTVKLTGNIYYYLPVAEHSVKVSLPPGKIDTLRTLFFYPDFIEFNSISLKIFNSPGKVVRCTIGSIAPFKVSFQGDLALENTYYQAFAKVARNNQVYYRAGATLKDFNSFPKLADSINRINLSFLDTYPGSLPATFKTQEYWRLTYNDAFLKYHVLFDKEFKSGQPIPVDPAYYSFEKDVPLSNKEMVLSTQYLWYALFNLRRKALLKDRNEANLTSGMLDFTDKLFAGDEMGDVVKMRLLYDTYPQSKQKFQTLDSSTSFLNPSNKLILDSVVNAKNLLPRIGKKVPDLKLINLKQDTVSLNDFAGHPVIVNFWATWCAGCIAEVPFENRIYNKYGKSKGLVVVNICVDSGPEEWKRVSLKHGLQMVNLYADVDQYEYLKKQFNLYALPRNILLGKDLKVINNNYKRASQLSEADLGN